MRHDYIQKKNSFDPPPPPPPGSRGPGDGNDTDGVMIRRSRPCFTGNTKSALAVTYNGRYVLS